jgi:epsilon-lactone hydrolase
MENITQQATHAQKLSRLAQLEQFDILHRVRNEPTRWSKILGEALNETLARCENLLIEKVSMARLHKVIRQLNNPSALHDFLQQMRVDVADGRKGTITLMAAGADGFKFIAEAPPLSDLQDMQSVRRILFYLPGGGFILPTSSHQRQRIAALAKGCQATAIIGEAQLAPEHPFPLPLHDLLRQYRQLLQEYSGGESEIFIGADTAGASLIMGMIQLAKKEELPMPRGIILYSPWGDLGLSGWSYLTKSATSNSPFRMEMAAFCARLYLGDQLAHDPLASCIYASLEGMPPITIHTSRNDVHFDDSVKLAENARKAGTEVELHYWDSARHHLERLGRADASKTVELTRNFMDKYSALRV